MTRSYVAVISFLASLSDRHEDGQGLAEYALAAGLVAVAAAAALTFLGRSLEDFYRAMEVIVGA